MATPSKLSDFQVLGRLGSGSFGTVYKVKRKVDGNIYVLKAVIIDGMSPKEQLEAINEVQIMASLDHPNCVRYYDSFLDGGRLNIIMEYCNGGDLQLFLKRLAKEKLRAPEPRVWRVFLQIAVGMHYLHKRRVLHRDMKSANVFLCKDETLKIGDLGVARVLGTNTNFAKTCVGTPYYLSPELCESKPYDDKSDVWALGCILYECLTLRHPFDATNQGALILKIIQGHYPPVPPTYSPEIRQLVTRLLSRDSRRRPSVQDLLALPMCVDKAAELGITLPPEAMALAEARAKARPGTLHRKTLRLNTGGPTSGDAPRKPPSGRAAAARAHKGAIRQTRVRRGTPSAVAERRPKQQPLSVEARAAARRSSSRGSVGASSTDSRPDSRSGKKPPALRFSPSGKLLSPTEREDASAVAALPDDPATPAALSPPVVAKACGSAASRHRASASELAALTQTLSLTAGNDAPKDGHAGIIQRNDDADDFDALMQAQYQRDVLLGQGGSAGADGAPVASAPPVAVAPRALAGVRNQPAASFKESEDDEPPEPSATPEPKKKVVYVKRQTPGVPDGFWDPVDPASVHQTLPDLPPGIPEGFWDPHEPTPAASAAAASAGAGAGKAADVAVSISAVEVSDRVGSAATDGATTTSTAMPSTMEFGGAHAVFVGVSGGDDPDDGSVEEEFDDAGAGASDGDGEAEDDGGGRRSGAASSVEEDLDALDDMLDTEAPMSVEELEAEDARIREQIDKQQERCEKILAPEVFSRLELLLTNHEDVDIDTLAAGSDPTKAAETVVSKMQGLDVHEYIEVYKLALYASKLRENMKELSRRQHG